MKKREWAFILVALFVFYFSTSARVSVVEGDMWLAKIHHTLTDHWTGENYIEEYRKLRGW